MEIDEEKVTRTLKTIQETFNVAEVEHLIEKLDEHVMQQEEEHGAEDDDDLIEKATKEDTK